MELSVFSSVMKRRKSTLKTELSTSTPWPNFRTWKRYKVKEKLFICICPWINPMTSAKENQGVCCCLSVCPFIAFSPQVISVPLTMFENHSESLILKLLEPLARCLFFHSNIFDKLAEAKLNIILGMRILMRHFAHNFQTLATAPRKLDFPPPIYEGPLFPRELPFNICLSSFTSFHINGFPNWFCCIDTWNYFSQFVT